MREIFCSVVLEVLKLFKCIGMSYIFKPWLALFPTRNGFLVVIRWSGVVTEQHVDCNHVISHLGMLTHSLHYAECVSGSDARKYGWKSCASRHLGSPESPQCPLYVIRCSVHLPCTVLFCSIILSISFLHRPTAS